LSKKDDKLSKFGKDRIILKHAEQHGLDFRMLVKRLKMKEQQIGDRFNELIEGISNIKISKEEKIETFKKYLACQGDMFKAMYQMKVKHDRIMYYFTFMRMVHAELKNLYPDRFTFSNILNMRKSKLSPYVWELYRSTFQIPSSPLAAYLFQLVQKNEVKLSCDSSLSEDAENLTITIEPPLINQCEKLQKLYSEVSEWDD
jgi:hypothetical protein